MTVPNLMAYDPAYAYELAVIIQDGMRRMFQEQEDVFYYITIMNENYAQPRLPDGCREGILKGLYALGQREGARVQLLGSGTILLEALKAQELLRDQFKVESNVWSATSYKALYLDGASVERWNRLHPGREVRQSHVAQCLNGAGLPVIASSDYVAALPAAISRWCKPPFVALGTDGFGRSDGRPALREFFEVDAAHIAYAALCALAEKGDFPRQDLAGAQQTLNIRTDGPDPVLV
jgi:pyruvate dehydrogenase E1 component